MLGLPQPIPVANARLRHEAAPVSSNGHSPRSRSTCRPRSPCLGLPRMSTDGRGDYGRRATSTGGVCRG
jgi:hypothetical protein